MNDAALRRVFDLSASGFLLITLSPVLVILLLGSWIACPWPPIFMAWRVGKAGQLYRHYKFRSMRAGPRFGRVYFESARMNAWGRFIRRWHGDELPELIHIFCGQMSFVGPRPLLPEHLLAFDAQHRQSVLPGWAGFAQLALLRNGLLQGGEQIFLDNAYVARISLSLNWRILKGTMYDSLFRRKTLVADLGINQYRRHLGTKQDIGDAT